MIDGCICFKKTFTEIKRLSEEENLTSLDSLVSEKNICCKCCMCQPYIEEMYKTGLTEFPIDYFKKDE